MSRILVHNPSAPEKSDTQRPAGLVRLRESRAGVLENGKHNAELLMTGIVAELGQRYGVIHTLTGHKPTAGPADPRLLDEFARQCDWVVVGSAD